jgi:hypothetical protein
MPEVDTLMPLAKCISAAVDMSSLSTNILADAVPLAASKARKARIRGRQDGR